MSKMRRCSVTLILAVATIVLSPLGVVPMVEAQPYEFKISIRNGSEPLKNHGDRNIRPRIDQEVGGPAEAQPFIIVPSFTKTPT